MSAVLVTARSALAILMSLIATCAYAVGTELRSAVADQDWATARDLVSNERVPAEQAIEALLVDRLAFLERAEHDSALIHLQLARRIATLYADAHGDSLSFRLIARQEALASTEWPTAHRAWQAYRAAEAAYGNAEPADAQRSLARADSLAQSIGDIHLLENIYNLDGSCHWMRGAFSEAREAYQRALTFARQLAHRTREVGLLRNIAATYQFQQRGNEAIDALQRVLAAAREIGHWKVYSQAVNDLGIIALHAGHLSEARLHFEEALALAQHHALATLAGNAHLNLGLTLSQQGDLPAAIPQLEMALKAARELGNRRMEIGALLNLAGIHADLERHSHRLALLNDALRIADEMGAADAAAQIRNELGETARQLGHPTDALSFHEEALDVFRHLDIARSEAIALHNIGLTCAELGDHAAAARAFEEEVAVLQARQDPAGLANAYIDLAWCHAQQGQYGAAEEWLRAAAKIDAARENALLSANIEQALGILLAAQGEDARARACFERVLAATAHLPFPTLRWRALVGKANLCLAAQEARAADSLLTEALDIIAATREDLHGTPLRLGFMEDKQGVAALRVRALVARERAEHAQGIHLATAFQVAERAHARVLLDIMADPGLFLRQRVDSLHWAEHLALRKNLNDRQAALAAAAAQSDWDARLIESLGQDVTAARRAFRASYAALSARCAALGVRRIEHEPLSADDVRRRVLARDEVLIEFLVAEDVTHAFRVDREDLAYHEIACSRDSLNALVTALRKYILADSSAATLQVLSEQLYGLLCAPLLGGRPAARRLLIVPDDILAILPFAALHDGEGFLAQRYALTLAPSASVLDPALAAHERRGERYLLAVGNPASYHTQHLLGSTHRGPQRWSFGELPFAEEEVRRILTHFKRARILIGNEATEEAVKVEAHAASHLHFATHGIAEEREPLMSALVLAQDDDATEDGLLQAHEIMALSLQADLVVLSACNTGLGRVTRGEGILGLTHAFLCAGVRALLISLWEIPDHTTCEFMDHFYADLAAGATPDEALHATYTYAIESGGSAREWAAFTLMQTGGRPAKTTFLAYLTERPIWLSGLFLLGALITAFIVRRRNR